MNLEEFENNGEYNDGWVEWPSFPENENKFDWSLSYEEMDRRFPPANFYKEGLELKSIIVPYNTKKKRAKWFQERKKSGSLLSKLPQPQIMSHHQWKKNKVVIAASVNKNVESPTIAAEKLKTEMEAKERSLFISRMTIEQFQLMQKHGWKIARALTANTENFHCE